MSWVIDTCLLIDVLDDDPTFGETSARVIDAHQADGLVVCTVSAIEMAPAFLGDWKCLHTFLNAMGVRVDAWHETDTKNAFHSWDQHVRARKSGGLKRRPVSDLMIGAFALRHEGLLTRNGKDFRKLFPDLTVKDH